MERKVIVNYRRQVNRGLLKVDKAISKDVYLTKEEWFDFLFKSAFLGFKSNNIKKYKVFHKDIVLLSESMAEAFGYMLDISLNGFKNTEYITCVRRIIRRMNRYLKKSNQLNSIGYDRDGYLFIRVYQGSDVVLTLEVSSKDEAVEKIITVMRYCIENIDAVCLGVEFVTFLKSYLQFEFSKIISCVDITPYVSGDTRLTLNDYLSGKYDGIATGGKLLFT